MFNKLYTVPIVNTLKDNIINVVFSKCDTSANGKRSSELFLRMLPQVSFGLKKIIEFKNKAIIEHDVDPLFSQKIGLSLRCDPKGTLSAYQEKKRYIWLMTDKNPKFYVILLAKNEAYELLLKYVKLDKNLTVSSTDRQDCGHVLADLRLACHFAHQAGNIRAVSEARVQ